MVAAEQGSAPITARQAAHPEEWLSILLALFAAVFAGGFLWLEPNLMPESHIAWAAAGWLAMAYMSLQMLALLVSATQIRALGVLDSIVAILPFVVGLVLIFE